jgi:hypothetical protein
MQGVNLALSVASKLLEEDDFERLKDGVKTVCRHMRIY